MRSHLHYKKLTLRKMKTRSHVLSQMLTPTKIVNSLLHLLLKKGICPNLILLASSSSIVKSHTESFPPLLCRRMTCLLMTAHTMYPKEVIRHSLTLPLPCSCRHTLTHPTADTPPDPASGASTSSPSTVFCFPPLVVATGAERTYSSFLWPFQFVCRILRPHKWPNVLLRWHTCWVFTFPTRYCYHCTNTCAARRPVGRFGLHQNTSLQAQRCSGAKTNPSSRQPSAQFVLSLFGVILVPITFESFLCILWSHPLVTTILCSNVSSLVSYALYLFSRLYTQSDSFLPTL
jgi:hypothetical protein